MNCLAHESLSRFKLTVTLFAVIALTYKTAVRPSSESNAEANTAVLIPNPYCASES